MINLFSLSNLIVFCFIAMAAKVIERERTPIIGVLTIDADSKLCKAYGAQVRTYIPASYVKWLEDAGARVVPIWINEDTSYYEDIMNKVNGILIPNANVEFINQIDPKCVGRSNHFFHTTKIIYKIAVRKNESKDIFPIWGISQGMHLLVMHSVQSTFDVDPRWTCNLMDVALPLEFRKNFRKSKMLQSIRQYVMIYMREVPFGYYLTNNCLVDDVLKLLRVDKEWHILASKKSEMKLDLVTLLEHNKYPFYGSQFHPERVRFEQLDEFDTGYHTEGATSAARYFADFFIGECRKSKNNFTSSEEEMQQMIWNYQVTLTARRALRWTQCYLFEDADLSYNGTEDEEKVRGCCS